MTQLFTSPKFDVSSATCTHGSCSNVAHPEHEKGAAWFNQGISHYSKSKGVSYIQVHDFPFACCDEHAEYVAHQKADAHLNLEHGVHNSSVLNPVNGHSDDLVRANAEYSPLGRAWSTLPKVDALTGSPLGDEMYVVHLDRWSNLDYSDKPEDFTHKQGGYFQFTGGELATATEEAAVQLMHILIDEVLSPSPKNSSWQMPQSPNAVRSKRNV